MDKDFLSLNASQSGDIKAERLGFIPEVLMGF